MMVWNMILYVKFLACTQLGNNNCSASMIVLLGIHGWSIRYHPKGFTGFLPSTLSNLYDINILQPYLQPYIISYQAFPQNINGLYQNIGGFLRRFGGFGDAFGGSGGSTFFASSEAEKLRISKPRGSPAVQPKLAINMMLIC